MILAQSQTEKLCSLLVSAQKLTGNNKVAQPATVSCVTYLSSLQVLDMGPLRNF
jgi:hypothetical protein